MVAPVGSGTGSGTGSASGSGSGNGSGSTGSGGNSNGVVVMVVVVAVVVVPAIVDVIVVVFVVVVVHISEHKDRMQYSWTNLTPLTVYERLVAFSRNGNHRRGCSRDSSNHKKPVAKVHVDVAPSSSSCCSLASSHYAN